MNNLRQKRCKKGGFTLIELVIVLAIMAVIALIAIPNFNSVKENSKVKADRQSAESIKRTVQLLIVDDTLKVTGDTNLTLNTNNESGNKISESINVEGKDKLEEALTYVNPPATDSGAAYEIQIKGQNVAVGVPGKDGTYTDGFEQSSSKEN
ncbi:MAG: type II secretion system protein [Sarcina sp.]